MSYEDCVLCRLMYVCLMKISKDTGGVLIFVGGAMRSEMTCCMGGEAIEVSETFSGASIFIRETCCIGTAET